MENEIKGSYRLLTPGLDNTCLFMSLTAGAGTRCMSLLSSSPNLFTSDIPFPWFLMLGCNSQAQDLRSHGGCRIIGPNVLQFHVLHLKGSAKVVRSSLPIRIQINGCTSYFLSYSYVPNSHSVLNFFNFLSFNLFWHSNLRKIKNQKFIRK